MGSGESSRKVNESGRGQGLGQGLVGAAGGNAGGGGGGCWWWCWCCGGAAVCCQAATHRAAPRVELTVHRLGGRLHRRQPLLDGAAGVLERAQPRLVLKGHACMQTSRASVCMHHRRHVICACEQVAYGLWHVQPPRRQHGQACGKAARPLSPHLAAAAIPPGAPAAASTTLPSVPAAAPTKTLPPPERRPPTPLHSTPPLPTPHQWAARAARRGFAAAPAARAHQLPPSAPRAAARPEPRPAHRGDRATPHASGPARAAGR